ncbi:hypothetical protein Ciccas_005673 [Cichlidogyrus casuarinus]|uniref:Uncharacterized protein n=1 Tax=Cichlidogyrus casuarinus TaxID=1844966 RepID=A0ABD2Q885_9PLAT
MSEYMFDASYGTLAEYKKRYKYDLRGKRFEEPVGTVEWIKDILCDYMEVGAVPLSIAYLLALVLLSILWISYKALYSMDLFNEHKRMLWSKELIKMDLKDRFAWHGIMLKILKNLYRELGVRGPHGLTIDDIEDIAIHLEDMHGTGAFRHVYEASQEDEKTEMLASRRKKIQSLYNAEQAQHNYEVMKLRQPENRKTLEQMRIKAEEYKQKNEEERRRVAEERYSMHYNQNDPKLREQRREEALRNTVETWDGQVNDSEQRAQEAHQQELLESELDRMRAQKEAQYAAEVERERVEKERLRSEFLQKQIQELRRSEQAAQTLLAEEEHLLKQQILLEELEAQKKLLDQQRMVRCHSRALLKQHNAVLRKKTLEVQTELQRDLEWLARLEREAMEERLLKEEQKRELCQELSRAREHIHHDMRLEKAREAEIDKLFALDAKQMWQKREKEWDDEAKAREMLLEDVLLQRKHQLLNQLACNRNQQMCDIQEREELLEKLDQMRVCDVEQLQQQEQLNQVEASLAQQKERDSHTRNDHQVADQTSDEHKARLLEQAYERRLRKEAQQLRDQAHSSVISGRPSNFMLDQLKKNQFSR